MLRVRIPNGWEPRWYQRPLWEYLERGGKRAGVCWHRRAGKDDVGLNYAAVSAIERPANYWHMLPEYRQSRKAIWEAVNPHTGIKRIDQAFPKELRRRTNDQEMFIEFLNGATWRVVGSDNFDSLVGSGPAGIVFSEWALSNPRAWAILGPMLEENGGWALFIYTARGQNHGYSLMQLAKESPDWFGQVMPATETNVFTAEQLDRIRQEYVVLDSQNGESLFNQEYLCDFTAAIHGSFWGKEMNRAEQEGRICSVPVDPTREVITAWDLGVRDATAIWFFQPLYGGINVVDYYEASGVGLEHYANVVRSKPYKLGPCAVPPDANVKEWGSGRTRVEQMLALGLNPRIILQHRLMDGIQAARATIPMARFDRERCKRGIEALKQYRAEYDDERKVLKPTPLHDWSSHAADAFRYLAMGWKELRAPVENKPMPFKGWETRTAGQLFALDRIARREPGRI